MPKVYRVWFRDLTDYHIQIWESAPRKVDNKECFATFERAKSVLLERIENAVIEAKQKARRLSRMTEETYDPLLTPK